MQEMTRNNGRNRETRKRPCLETMMRRTEGMAVTIGNETFSLS